MAEVPPRYRHILVPDPPRAEAYRAPNQGGGGRPEVPTRDRPSHGASLRAQLTAVQEAMLPTEDLDVPGLNVEFESFPEVELAFESLALERSGFELRNVRREGDRTLATVFIPFGKLPILERRLADYLALRRSASGRAADHRPLLDAIEKIRVASLQALWTDEGPFPVDEAEPFRWEVWLPSGRAPAAAVAAFRAQLAEQGGLVLPGDLRFPERVVLIAKASPGQLTGSVAVLNSIAELRAERTTAAFFNELPLNEQYEWANELLERTHFPPEGADVTHLCLLDTGVNRGHPLLAPGLASGDLHSVEPAWGTDDKDGHGTKMAGLALFGDLADAMESGGPVEIEHRLESVKLIPKDGAQADPDHYGHRTVEAVARSESAAPHRSRLFALALTAPGPDGRGKPSAWSAALDRLAAGGGDADEPRRLIVVAAGNSREASAWIHYPASNLTDSIESPAQAWNALTVGAFTGRVDLAAHPGYTPLAPKGGLSPFSRTSMTWDRSWPLKPDVVFEGGNLATNSLGPGDAESLDLLTTNSKPTERLVTTARGTSVAAALAGRAAARILALYPELRPETVRGLLVHSAEWTAEMRRQFLPATGTPTKADHERLVRACGFGQPSLERALWTLRNAVTLVAEAEITPFEKVGNAEPKAREVCFHELPWPRAALEALGETDIVLRVTLSYFVEPNPSTRGVNSRYRYPSHGLRFAVKHSTESLPKFEKRINAAAREEGEKGPGSPTDDGWLIGPNARHRGSLHADIWQGSAVALAARGLIAVYPSPGWWKTRPALGRFATRARYSLIVSIHAPDVDVDLYTEVANQVGIDIPNQT